MATAIAQLKALMGIDTKQAEKAVDNIGNKVKNLGSNQLAGLKSAIAGAFSIGALVMFGRKMLQTADDLQTAANVYGTTMETMIAFKSVMAETGIGADRFNKIFGRIKTMQADVSAGLTTYTRELDKMNISQEEMIGLNAPDVLLLLAKKYEEAADKQLFLEATAKLLGTRMVELVEVFQRMNKEGMEKFTEEAEKAARGMKVLADLADKLEKGWDKTTNAFARLVGGFEELARKGGEEFAAEWMFAMGEIDAKTREHMLAISKADRVIRIGFEEKPAEMEEKIETETEIKKRKSDEERWYKLYEDSLLRQMSILGQIMYYEEEVAKLKEAQKVSPADLGIAADILEREKKINDLYEKRESIIEKMIGLYEQQDKLAEDYEQKAKDIQAGKGIETPALARVGELQRIGGIIGGVAGAGSQEARIAEATRKATEAIETLHQETNRRLKQIEDKIFELGQD